MVDAPLTHEWLKTLRARLEPRGAKADLARFLAGRYGGDGKYWERRLQTILTGRGSPRTEFYLATEDYFRQRTASP